MGVSERRRATARLSKCAGAGPIVYPENVCVCMGVPGPGPRLLCIYVAMTCQAERTQEHTDTVSPSFARGTIVFVV